MPTTCYPSPHGANAIPSTGPQRSWVGVLRNPATTPLELLSGTCSQSAAQCKQLYQTSFNQPFDSCNLRGTDNGFVHAAVMAYSNHHHLMIRPDEVWMAVLAQLSVYVNAHAEELRSMFVTHEGKEELVIIEDNLSDIDFGRMARKMTKLMECKIVDPGLREWIMKEFTTTTDTDRTCTAIAMMGAMQSYFSYRFALRCGLPSVTLLGEREDWVKLLDAVERLPTFGAEPAEWAKLLRVVFKRFVQTFEDPKANKVIDFWQHVAHYSGNGSGPRYLSGWITAFCFWDVKGNCLQKQGIESLTSSLSPKSLLRSGHAVNPKLTISGVTFHRISADNVPKGWVSVPVTVEILGVEYSTTMIAGAVAIEALESGQELEGGGKGLDTVRPKVGWWMYENNEGAAESVQH